MEPKYTFVSVSTAKPGRLEDLVRIASAPSEKMEGVVPGMLGRQVSVDEKQNTVVVWVAFDAKESLYDYLETEKGKQDHDGDEDMEAIIDSFTMYDLVPRSRCL